MQRLFSLKQATKLLKHHHTALSPYPSLSPQKSTSNLALSHPLPLYIPNQPFSHFATASRSGIASGFPKNPRIMDQFVKIFKLRGFSEGFANSRVGFLKNHLYRQSSGSISSFKAHNRGWQSWLRRQSPDQVALALILTNVAVFMLWRIADREFMMRNFTVSLENFRSGRLHTLITPAFSQIDAGHLISNMIGLYVFGTSIGRNFGSVFLLKLYLAGAFVGSLFFLFHKSFLVLNSKNISVWGMNPSRIPGLGASGAVNAIMLLDIFLDPKATLYFEFIIPVPAILLGILLIGKDILRIWEGDSQVSGSAHLGGAVVAALAWARIRKRLF